MKANAGCNSTTRSMNFTRMKRSSKCMQILKHMILFPRMHGRVQILERVYGESFPGTRNWGHGFFAALVYNKLAKYEQHGHACVWEPTVKGINFYKSLCA